jgi:leucyl-tRNA synthetase
VTGEFERWSYNTAVAAFMEFTNLLYKRGSTAFAIDTLLQLLAPMAPHITAELWARRHDGEHVHERTWPVADPAMTTVDSVTMIVQVNGKVRAKLEVSPDISEAEATRLAVDAVSVEPSRVIAKPPKLVNIVG